MNSFPGLKEVIVIGPMAETALDLVASLKTEGLADIFIVSAHAGMVAEFDEEGGSDSAERIATLVPNTDVLVVGHMHITVKDRIGDTIIGGPRNLGREVVHEAHEKTIRFIENGVGASSSTRKYRVTTRGQQLSVQ
ncbi:hypothetical protein A8L34_27650 [Bacillus sp. FJAT-27264]|uniref:hypothetical protein n=1 Tax=Paenibacillus sp. (strain DSM 101736 / FJAT-27264) TaxID=1850362 RepID=UPI000807DF3F|nr:hypothetical protein [Bacillus sp. FJAT-27264]OBZ16203.1 hypothetical protein A8L34_27650 [Bacillus sp. FJAT-27264]